MYAIVETGGKQYRVKPGDTVAVERLSGEPGETLDFDRVLLVAGNGKDAARVGSPGVEGAIVRAEVVEHIRGQKIIVFRYKSKVRYRRKTGHRQSLTRLRITDILLDGASSVAADEARRAPALAPESAAPPEALEMEEAPEPTAVAEPTQVAAEDMPPSAGEAGPTPESVPPGEDTAAAAETPTDKTETEA